MSLLSLIQMSATLLYFALPPTMVSCLVIVVDLVDFVTGSVHEEEAGIANLTSETSKDVADFLRWECADPVAAEWARCAKHGYDDLLAADLRDAVNGDSERGEGLPDFWDLPGKFSNEKCAHLHWVYTGLVQTKARFEVPDFGKTAHPILQAFNLQLPQTAAAVLADRRVPHGPEPRTPSFRRC